MKYLSEAEKSAIKTFCENKAMFNAVKKVLLAGIYINGTLKPDVEPDTMRNWALQMPLGAEHFTDEQLGSNLRASAEGLNFVEAGFSMLEKIKVEEPKKEKKNPAL